MFTKMTVIALALSFGISVGQTPSRKPIEPKSVGDFFLLDPDTQDLKDLPVEMFKFDIEQHQVNHLNVLMTGIKLSGTGSPFHIAVNNKTQFIFKTENPEQARLFLLTVNAKKQYRSCIIVSSKSEGFWGTQNSYWEPGIAVDIIKFGDSSYKLTPQQPLGLGEYALLIGENARRSSTKIFTFALSGPVQQLNLQQPDTQPQFTAQKSARCIAVQELGRFGLRNANPADPAGGLISKKEYEVLDVVNYPDARFQIGRRLHGHELQSLQTEGTAVVILSKNYSNKELQKACH
jgi:hypothetical protein